MVSDKTFGDRLFVMLNSLLMIFVVLIALYPLYYSIINSLNDGNNITNYGMVLLWPRMLTLESWKTVLRDKAVINALQITASRTIIVTAASTVITSMFAYALSRQYLRGRTFYVVLGFVSMYISGGIISSFLLISWLKLYNTYWVYIIPSLFGGFYNVIIYTSNFKGIPDALFESAQIDGASEYRIFFEIVFPLSKPVIAALSIFTIVALWNDYSTTLYFTAGSSDLMTLQYYILQIVRNRSAQISMRNATAASNPEVFRLLMEREGPVSSKTLELAAMVIASLPMVIMYPFAQRFFVKGVMIGSIKG
ncbi:ABC transporter permease [Clostridia bacterium]|nr:ABC transporter permease [Clostridia bacterium]